MNVREVNTSIFVCFTHMSLISHSSLGFLELTARFMNSGSSELTRSTDTE